MATNHLWTQTTKGSDMYYQEVDTGLGMRRLFKTKCEIHDPEAVFKTKDTPLNNLLLDNNRVIDCETPPKTNLKRTKNAQKEHNSKREWGIDEVRGFVRSQGFKYWEIRSLDYELDIYTPEDKHYRRRLISLLEERGEIEQHPTNGRKYRQISQDDVIDYKTKGIGNPLAIWLPFDIHEHFLAYPGNLLDFAGVTDAGKTALAINIIKNNDESWQIDYWTNEMSGEEINERLQNIQPDKCIDDWNFNARVIKPGYLQKIRPNILSIFDYVDVGDPYYRIAEEQQNIHDAIGGGIAIIFLQKDDSQRRIAGRGKEFSTQLPRLYISMSRTSAFAYKAKTPKNPIDPLRGKTCNFTLTNGVHFKFEPWHYKNIGGE